MLYSATIAFNSPGVAIELAHDLLPLVRRFCAFLRRVAVIHLFVVVFFPITGGYGYTKTHGRRRFASFENKQEK